MFLNWLILIQKFILKITDQSWNKTTFRYPTLSQLVQHFNERFPKRQFKNDNRAERLFTGNIQGRIYNLEEYIRQRFMIDSQTIEVKAILTSDFLTTFFIAALLTLGDVHEY